MRWKRVTNAVLVVAAMLGVATAARAGAQQRDPRATIFVARGCSQCHGVWALGVKAKSDVGPDLTFAYVDVVNRYGTSLEAFLYNPTGVMRLMLASHLHLSSADRDSITHILGHIYRLHRAQLRQEIPPIAKDTPSPD